jgi:hypothetical protein
LHATKIGKGSLLWTTPTKWVRNMQRIASKDSAFKTRAKESQWGSLKTRRITSLKLEIKPTTRRTKERHNRTRDSSRNGILLAISSRKTTSAVVLSFLVESDRPKMLVQLDPQHLKLQ